MKKNIDCLSIDVHKKVKAKKEKKIREKKTIHKIVTAMLFLKPLVIYILFSLNSIVK